MPLLPYQKEFLAWAIKQERSDVRGGCAPGAAAAGAACTGCAMRWPPGRLRVRMRGARAVRAPACVDAQQTRHWRVKPAGPGGMGPGCSYTCVAGCRILADEMGMGKTIQVLLWVAAPSPAMRRGLHDSAARRRALLRSGEGAPGVRMTCVPCMCACIGLPCPRGQVYIGS